MVQSHVQKFQRIGIIGAGTMGSGIALLGLRGGMTVHLFDVSRNMLESGSKYIEKHLARKNQQELRANLQLTTELAALAHCEAIIEAAPERIDIKQKLFAELDSICGPNTVLASNTSTLPVTQIAAAAATPERVGGMHFFNPAPVLPLVEVVRGAQTSEATVEAMVRLAAQLGKTPVVLSDSPGFIVNRIARPFYGEALRLVSERIATHQQVDRITEHSGGFRMGPFRLMDLIGIDINFTAMKSMYEQTFGDARYRPSLLQLQKIQENALGKKTGRGFYDYHNEDSSSTGAPALESSSIFNAPVYISPGNWAPGLPELCRQNGINVQQNLSSKTAVAVCIAGREQDNRTVLAQLEKQLSPEATILCQCVDVTLSEIATWLANPRRLAGFDGLFFSRGSVVTCVGTPELSGHARKHVEQFVASLKRTVEWIDDGPALVTPRIVAMLANEAFFAIGEGLAEAETIDKAMQLGVNYPKGPHAWAQEIGFRNILAILDHLYEEYHEERYRAAPLLRRSVRQYLHSAPK